MSINADLTVYNRDDQPTLLVEVTKKLGASREWAAQLRRNLYAHGTLPRAKFFLLAMPDRFYLWKQNGADLELKEPVYAIDSRPILNPYFERAGVTANKIDGQSLELIIGSWLAEIIYADKRPEDFDDSQKWLIESGLYEAVAGGRFEYEKVV
jgi:hypothetical protein